MSGVKVMTEAIQLAPAEHKELQRVSQEAYLTPSAMAKKLVLEGLSRWRLERAIQFYANGEASLSGAARYARVSVYQLMRELHQRGVSVTPPAEDFLHGLENLAAIFDAPDLHEVAVELREHPELWE